MSEGSGANVDLGDAVIDGGGFVERPEERVILSGGGKALRCGGEAFGHAKGEPDIDCEREARASAEESASDGVEDGGIDQAFAGAEIVVRDGEIALHCGSGEGANGLGMERLGFGTEKDAGGCTVFLCEFIGVEVVGGSEDPGGR